MESVEAKITEVKIGCCDEEVCRTLYPKIMNEEEHVNLAQFQRNLGCFSSVCYRNLIASEKSEKVERCKKCQEKRLERLGVVKEGDPLLIEKNLKEWEEITASCSTECIHNYINYICNGSLPLRKEISSDYLTYELGEKLPGW